MSRFHINPETGNAGACRAKKNCPFGDLEKDHYESKDEARAAFEAKQKTFNQRQPIILPPAPGLLPEQWSTDFYSLLEALDTEEIDYYSNDYGQITWVNLPKAIEIVTGVKEKDWPESLHKIVDKNRKVWAEPSQWEIENGYYDTDSPTLETPVGFEITLRQWYYDQPNAEDHRGILRHVREKGHATEGLEPHDAVKKMLRDENNKVLQYVERASYVSKGTINFKDIVYSEQHYKKIEPRKPERINKDSDEIIGVLIHRDGKNRLLDGHHRLKYSEKENTSGQFIILR